MVRQAHQQSSEAKPDRFLKLKGLAIQVLEVCW